MDDDEELGPAPGTEVEDAPPDPRQAAKLFRQAKVAHRKRVDQLPTFLQSGDLTFKPDSPEHNALNELRVKVVRAARTSARKLCRRAFRDQGYDAETVAMALVSALVVDADIAAMFAPSRPDLGA